MAVDKPPPQAEMPENRAAQQPAASAASWMMTLTR
jgi:hypothetical protein